MSKKKTPPQQQVRISVPVVETSTDSIIEEVYVPSVNSDKYPVTEVPKVQYKILAFRNDYVKLQDEVVKYLNEGWELSGGVSVCMSTNPYETVTIFTQAIFKK
jgi:hypothetical protein